MIYRTQKKKEISLGYQISQKAMENTEPYQKARYFWWRNVSI